MQQVLVLHPAILFESTSKSQLQVFLAPSHGLLSFSMSMNDTTSLIYMLCGAVYAIMQALHAFGVIFRHYSYLKGCLSIILGSYNLIEMFLRFLQFPQKITRWTCRSLYNRKVGFMKNCVTATKVKYYMFLSFNLCKIKLHSLSALALYKLLMQASRYQILRTFL